jgi:hypothetical protein
LSEDEQMSEASLAQLAADEATLSPAPWKLWTSCSYRRIGGASGHDGDVLHAYNQRPDGQPDLSMSEVQLFALVRLRNALPELLAKAADWQAMKDERDAASANYANLLADTNGEIAELRALLRETAGAIGKPTHGWGTLRNTDSVDLRGQPINVGLLKRIHRAAAGLRTSEGSPTAEGRRANPDSTTLTEAPQ